MTVRIVTDSGSDLTDEETARLGIDIVPLSIRFGDEELLDRDELTVDDFYRRMASSDHLPQTAAPAPGAFEQVFRRRLDEGADAVVCINLSSSVSATMQSAEAGGRDLGDRVRILDSRSVSVGQGTIVLAAATAAADGASTDDIAALVADLTGRNRVYGALDTLENLKKGGRIGNAQALLGSVLSIKPLIDISSGEVEEAGRQRTRKKSLAWLRDQVLHHGDQIEHLAVAHAMADDVAPFIADLAATTGRDDIRSAIVGRVVASHGGPGLVAVNFTLAG